MKVVVKLLIFLLIVFLIFCSMVFAYVYFTLGDAEQPYVDLIEKYAAENELETTLVAGVIRTESNFRPEVVSNANAIGLMQLLPDTARWVAERMDEEFVEEKLIEPEYNIKMGTYYLKYLFNYFGSIDYAIIAYNGGLGNLQTWIDGGIVTNDSKSYADIPIAETKNYVERVKDYKELYDVIWEPVVKDASSSQFLRTYKTIKTIILSYFD